MPDKIKNTVQVANKRVVRPLVRRVGTFVATSLGTWLALTPEATHQLIVAIVALGMVAVEIFYTGKDN